MITNVTLQSRSECNFAEHVTETLVVRSTTQKDVKKAFPHWQKRPFRGNLRSLEMCYYRLHGTDKMISVAIEGIERMARVETQENTWSFDEIYDEYKTPIYNYVYHLVGDREQADDLTQDTFLKAFRALPKMDASLKLSAWLYRIATNTAYDALRRRKLIAWLPWQDLDHEPADVEGTDPQEIYGTTELVRAALHRMPPQYRVALLLYTQEGFSYNEIAETLNIAESGVKMYLSRARQSFREHYRALEQGGGSK